MCHVLIQLLQECEHHLLAYNDTENDTRRSTSFDYATVSNVSQLLQECEHHLLA